MSITSASKNAALYLFGVALSCGPSQLYGVVKGVVDLEKYAELRDKIAECENVQRLYRLEKFAELKHTKAFKELQARAPNNEKELYQELVKKASEQHFELTQEQKLIGTSLKIDLVSLLPLVGALCAWRLDAGNQSCGLACLPGIEYSVAHATNNYRSIFQKFLYPYSGKTLENYVKEGHTLCQQGRIQIPVPSRSGQALDALFWPGTEALPTDPAIVLFHGNGMTAHDFMYYLKFFQSLGFNVLAPTMGGYPGSPGVDTSEASTYQDVEAIKLFLQKQGIKQAGYYGLSIGGTLAFQAATAASEADIQPLFVVADQTFTSGVQVVEHNSKEILSNDSIDCTPLGRGVAHAALPRKGVRLSDKLTITTDGLNNIHKASILRDRNIPLLSIKSSQDEIMGWNYDPVKKCFKGNFADDLNHTCYAHCRIKGEAPLLEIPGEHGACILQYPQKWGRLADFVLANKS